MFAQIARCSPTDNWFCRLCFLRAFPFISLVYSVREHHLSNGTLRSVNLKIYKFCLSFHKFSLQILIMCTNNGKYM